MLREGWWLYLWIPFALTLGVLTDAVAANGEAQRPWGMQPWGMHMMWDSWGIGMMIMMFIFWAVIIAGMVFFDSVADYRWHFRATVRNRPWYRERHRYFEQTLCPWRDQ